MKKTISTMILSAGFLLAGPGSAIAGEVSCTKTATAPYIACQDEKGQAMSLRAALEAVGWEPDPEEELNFATVREGLGFEPDPEEELDFATVEMDCVKTALAPYVLCRNEQGRVMSLRAALEAIGWEPDPEEELDFAVVLKSMGWEPDP
uniref:hypothetical protein n=1 Tax=Thioalkalivibrio sp. HK1 TaxID=1469245 RepID=UPI0005719F4E